MATNKDICETALSKVGQLQYKFGGDNISGGYGDCSDFTEYVYQCYGFEIGTTTNEQYTHGFTSIPFEQIAAGDLVFFKNTYDSKYTDGVSHVGIALGNNKFVHLGNSGCSVSDLTSRYYSNHYLAAKRVNGVQYVDAVVDADVEPSNKDSSPSSDTSFVGSDLISNVLKVTVICLCLVAGIALLATSVGFNLKKE